jgi:(2R)-ethylmalonyl-CoA mutase
MSRATTPAPQPKKNSRPREPWIIRTYAGFGDARQANRRFLENLSRGQRGLSIAFDLPTQNGYDPDAPVAAGEVGNAGVSICHWRDMEELLAGIDLGAINTSMTINATAPFLLALYLVVAEKRGVPWTELRGTTQNDMLKEFVARGTSIFHPEVSFRISTELISFAVERVPNWNPINCCGYHYMESGAGPAEEIGYTFGNALMILDALRPRLVPEAFEQTVRRISFFINSGIELVPEISKVRAYFKLWRELCRDEYGIADVAFRAGCQVRSLTLTERQPELNIIRIAYEALPVVISAAARVNALQLPGFREAMALPDQAEQALSLRTQQILMHETGLAEWGDIFEGSKVVEKLTGGIAERAHAIALGLRAAGYSRAIAAVGSELTQLLAERQRKLASGELVQVGVNAFLDEIGLTGASAVTDDAAEHAAAERERIESLVKWRRERDSSGDGAVARALEALERGRRRRRRYGADDRSGSRRRHGRRVDRRDRARDQRPLHAARARSHDGARTAQRASRSAAHPYRARQGRAGRPCQRDQAARPRLPSGRDGGDHRGLQADPGATGRGGIAGGRGDPRRQQHGRLAHDDRG